MAGSHGIKLNLSPIMASRIAPELRERVRIDARPKAKRDAARRKELMEEAQMQQFARQAVSDTRRVEGDTKLDAQGNTWRYNAAKGAGEMLGKLDPVTGQAVAPNSMPIITDPVKSAMPLITTPDKTPTFGPGSTVSPQTAPATPGVATPPANVAAAAPLSPQGVPPVAPAPARTVSVGGQYGSGSVTHGQPGVKSTIPIAPKPVIADENGAVDLKASMRAGRTINAAPPAPPINIAGVPDADNARLNANQKLLDAAKGKAARLSPPPVNNLALPINQSSVTAVTKPAPVAPPAPPAAVTPTPRPDQSKFRISPSTENAYTSL